MRCSTFAALVFASALAPAAALAAPGSAPLAAPGPCAEPRRFDASGACADCADPARSGGFDVSGPARARFTPADVAAGPAEAPLASPENRGFVGRGPCDVPGSGCTGPIAPAPRGSNGGGGNGGGLTVVEQPPKPGRPPGTNPRR
jgi:hypothetical protein